MLDELKITTEDVMDIVVAEDGDGSSPDSLVLCRGCSSSQCFQENNPKESLVSVG